MDTTLSFGERTFSGIDLGDRRRTARLIQATDDMCRHPGGTLPDKFPKPADLRAFYRLMNGSATLYEIHIRERNGLALRFIYSPDGIRNLPRKSQDSLRCAE